MHEAYLVQLEAQGSIFMRKIYHALMSTSPDNNILCLGIDRSPNTGFCPWPNHSYVHPRPWLKISYFFLALWVGWLVGSGKERP